MKKHAIAFSIFLFFSATSFLQSQTITGRWVGTLSLDENNLELIFNIEKLEGELKATIDVPRQGARGIPVESIQHKRDSLFIFIQLIGASFAGDYDEDNQQLNGTWEQGGVYLPLSMKRLAVEPNLERPQNPKEPFPYHYEDVFFENQQADVSLSGTFSRPIKEGLYPAVILISGSGAQNRDGTIMDHKPLLVLGDYLTKKGLAVLRYDDRGFGQSSGDFITATTEDFASDATAAFTYLQNRADVDDKQIGILGMSEGGLIALIVGNQKPARFLILLASPSIPGNELIMLQTETLLRKGEKSEAEIKQSLIRYNKILETVLSDLNNENKSKELEKLLKPEVESLSSNEEFRTSYINGQISHLLSPWYRNFISYNPAISLAKTKVPVLSLFGSKDVQVPPQENLRALQKIVQDNEKNNYTIEVVEGVNHLFQPASSGFPEEYNQIEITIAPEVLERISNWMENYVY